jgi:hypothetical protein
MHESIFLASHSTLFAIVEHVQGVKGTRRWVPRLLWPFVSYCKLFMIKSVKSKNKGESKIWTSEKKEQQI